MTGLVKSSALSRLRSSAQSKTYSLQRIFSQDAHRPLNLWYFRARYFSDEMGRFISRDPLGYVDGFSLYGAYFAEGFGIDPWGTTKREYDIPINIFNDKDVKCLEECGNKAKSNNWTSSEFSLCLMECKGMCLNDKRCNSSAPENKPICCEKWEYVWKTLGYQDGTQCINDLLGGTLLKDYVDMGLKAALQAALKMSKGMIVNAVAIAAKKRIARDLCNSSICLKQSRVRCYCEKPLPALYDNWICDCPDGGGVADGPVMMPQPPKYKHPSKDNKRRAYRQSRN